MATATMTKIAEIVPHPSGNGFGVKVGKHRWISGGAGPMGGGDIGRFPTEAAAQAEATRLGYKIDRAPSPTPKAKVEGITYYRGVSRHTGMEAPTSERRRPSTYLTRSEREAKFYGKDIEKVTVKPKNPMYSETAVDAAEKLGVIEDYDKYIGSDPIKADEVIYNAAKS